MQIFRRRPPVVTPLHSFDPFKECTRAQLREAERLAECVKVARGRVVMREGQLRSGLFLIRSGTVEMTKRGQVLDTLGPNEVFGEVSALSGTPCNGTATAISELDLLVIGRREFNAVLRLPAVRDALLKKMAHRVHAVEDQLTVERTGPASTRRPNGDPGVGAPMHAVRTAGVIP